MSKYVKLQTMRDSFIKAASNANDSFMIAKWTWLAEQIQQKIDDMTIKESLREIEV